MADNPLRSESVDKKRPSGRKTPDIGVLVGVGIALIAAGVWVASWLSPIPDEAARVEAQGPAQKTDSENRPGTQAADAPSPPPVIAQSPPPPQAPLRGASAEPAAVPSQTPKAPSKSPDESVAATPAAQTAKRVSPAKDNSDLSAMRGRYTGNFVDSGSAEIIGLTLVISSVEDGVFKGTATLGGRGCDGSYPMQGTFRNNQLDLRATRNGGPAGDCPLSLALEAQGSRFVGAMGNGSKVQLSR